MNFTPKKIAFLVGGGIVALVVVILIFSSFTSVPSGHVGIVSAFGQVDSHPLPEGLHPVGFWKSVTPINVRLQSPSTTADSASKDLQKVHTQVTVPYTITASDGATIFQK